MLHCGPLKIAMNRRHHNGVGWPLAIPPRQASPFGRDLVRNTSEIARPPKIAVFRKLRYHWCIRKVFSEGIFRKGPNSMPARRKTLTIKEAARQIAEIMEASLAKFPTAERAARERRIDQIMSGVSSKPRGKARRPSRIRAIHPSPRTHARP